jgi:hypothetical protein
MVFRSETHANRGQGKWLLNGSLLILKITNYEKTQWCSDQRLMQIEARVNGYSMDLS